MKTKLQFKTRLIVACYLKQTLNPCYFIPFFLEILQDTRIILWMVENFLTKFRSSTPRFYGNILTLLYLKFETSVHAQIEITHYYLHISWHDMKFKHKLDILFDERMVNGFTNLVTWWKHILFYRLSTVLLSNLLSWPFKFLACAKVNVSNLEVSY